MPTGVGCASVFRLGCCAGGACFWSDSCRVANAARASTRRTGPKRIRSEPLPAEVVHRPDARADRPPAAMPRTARMRLSIVPKPKVTRSPARLRPSSARLASQSSPFARATREKHPWRSVAAPPPRFAKDSGIEENWCARHRMCCFCGHDGSDCHRLCWGICLLSVLSGSVPGGQQARADDGR